MRRMWSTQKWARHGSQHSQWKGGKSRDKNGYIKLNINLIEPEYWCMCDKSGWVLEHRYVVAKSLGRPLTREELVHHLDDDKINNSLCNLELTTRGQHMLHHKAWEVMSKGRDKLKKRFICLNNNIEYLGYSSAAEALGISKDTIRRCLKDNKSRMGYTFAYV